MNLLEEEIEFKCLNFILYIFGFCDDESVKTWKKYVVFNLRLWAGPVRHSRGRGLYGTVGAGPVRHIPEYKPSQHKHCHKLRSPCESKPRPSTPRWTGLPAVFPAGWGPCSPD